MKMTFALVAKSRPIIPIVNLFLLLSVVIRRPTQPCIKGRIRKDKTGKPYLEYIINIDYDNVQNWNINRRFNQFTNLYKTLRSISQENFDLPESSNIFSNITAMFSGLSHENKIIQLEKYLKDLTEVPEISNSKQLYFFLELNHIYELNQ